MRSLAAESRFHGAVSHLLKPEQLPRLTQEQAEVLAIVITDGMATRRRIEEVRGAAQLSIGPEGPVSQPRDSSETLGLLLSRGLLCADGDDHAMGRPLVYRPTPRLLKLVEVETLEEARLKLGVPTDYGYAWQPSLEVAGKELRWGPRPKTASWAATSSAKGRQRAAGRWRKWPFLRQNP